MDASSARASCSADEAILFPLSSSSLPPSHYLQTSPHLLTASDNRLFFIPNASLPVAPAAAAAALPTVATSNIVYNSTTANCNNNNSSTGNLSSFDSSILATAASSAANASAVEVKERTDLTIATSCHSLNLAGSCDRRQSLKSDARIPENETCCSSRSTSSPQLMSVKGRSKVYRRASLKSLVSLSMVPAAPAQSKIMRLTNHHRSGRVADRRAISLDSRPKSPSHLENKENLTCFSPILNSHPYSNNTSRSKSIEENKLEMNLKSNDVQISSSQQDEKQQQPQHQQQQQSKSKSTCSSFLPILSLIPHTAITFQYPSPKMKFSWWRNKIS